MNEQEITSAVQAVLEQMKEAAPQHTIGCNCEHRTSPRNIRSHIWFHYSTSDI